MDERNSEISCPEDEIRRDPYFDEELGDKDELKIPNSAGVGCGR
ncbi:MAG: hypothetical protein QXR87_02455 [Candidatus Hadarchaeales archaeon]